MASTSIIEILPEVFHVLAGILAGWSTLSLLTQWFDPFVFRPDSRKFMAGKCAVEETASEQSDASSQDEAEENDCETSSCNSVKEGLRLLERYQALGVPTGTWTM
mmetsp:Transcript_62490/g.116144  ORF Transcript_62490/g.116144 Transcript_62490/m.116144 type:complete len:105 (+) Transcript_62490:181-495(+)